MLLGIMIGVLYAAWWINFARGDGQNTVLPPIGQWVSCNDTRYSIGNHGLCDFPNGTDGSDMTQLNIDCDTMMYSDNWTLGYLRNVSACCSNGGPQE